MLVHVRDVEQIGVLQGEFSLGLQAVFRFAGVRPRVAVVPPPRDLGAGESAVRLDIQERRLLVRVVIACSESYCFVAQVLHDAAELAGVLVGRGSYGAIGLGLAEEEVVVAHPAHLGARIGPRGEDALERCVRKPGGVHLFVDLFPLHIEYGMAHEVGIDFRLPARAFFIGRAGGLCDCERACRRDRVALRELEYDVPARVLWQG